MNNDRDVLVYVARNGKEEQYRKPDGTRYTVTIGKKEKRNERSYEDAEINMNDLIFWDLEKSNENRQPNSQTNSRGRFTR